MKSEEVFNLEWMFFNKYWEVIIIGSCSLLLIIVMYVYFKLKKCIKVLCIQLEEKVEQYYDLYLDLLIDDVVRNYKSFDFDGMFDFDLYENIWYSQ